MMGKLFERNIVKAKGVRVTVTKNKKTGAVSTSYKGRGKKSVKVKIR